MWRWLDSMGTEEKKALQEGTVTEPNTEKSEGSTISRRTFLAISGCTLAAVAANQFLTRPEVSLAVSPQEIRAAGVEEKLVPTTCLSCQGGCPTIARVVNGNAVNIAGNPLSITEGATCPRAPVGLQVVYDRERVRSPLARTSPTKGRGVAPGWRRISWDEALEKVATRLKGLRNRSEAQKLLLIYGLNSQSSKDLLFRFAEAYGTPNLLAEEAPESQGERFGRWMADGQLTPLSYDLGRANYILAFGADFLQSTTSLGTTLRGWGKMRRERGVRGKVVVIDPRYSVTASQGDEWIVINLGTDAALALGVAHVLIEERLYNTGFVQNHCAGFEEFRALVLKDYSPENVVGATGVHADTIRRIAREFAHTCPAIAWVGRGAAGWANGAYASYAIHCLNALVGSLDVPGGILYSEAPQYRKMLPVARNDAARKGRDSAKVDSMAARLPFGEVMSNNVTDAILSGKPYPLEMAIGFNANLNMSATSPTRWDDALKKIPFYVHVAPFPSEMAQYADIVLPATTYLEEWGYQGSVSGFPEVSLVQPAVEAHSHVRPVIDIIFEFARRTGGTVAQSFSGIGDGAEQFVKYRTGNLISWDKLRSKGVWSGSSCQYRKYRTIFNTPSKKFEFRSGNYEALVKKIGVGAKDKVTYLPHFEPPKFFGSEKDFPLTLITYRPATSSQNGSQNYPWVQEIFLVQHGHGWTNFAEINSQTAEAYGFKDGDMVWVESPFGKLKITARVFEGIKPGVVAIALGQGHYSYGKWQRDMGVNPNEIVGVDYDHLSGGGAFFNTRVRIQKV
jgi:anaerobic selenocysteine-containing dehydrogenase